MSDPCTWPLGSICWIDYGSVDPQAAAEFYRDVLGFELADNPFGVPGYQVAKLGDDLVAGFFDNTEGGSDPAESPSGWRCYVRVADVAASLEKAGELGGLTWGEAKEIAGVGVLGEAQGPAGSIVTIFQPGGHPGAARLDDVPGCFAWFELLTDDPKWSEWFYVNLLGWTAGEVEKPDGPYTELSLDGVPIAGVFPTPEEWSGTPSQWIVYFAVADCEQTLEKALAAGAAVKLAPNYDPALGRFAILADPAGALFGVVELPRDAA